MPWILYASGRHYAHWVDCRRWDCAKCARDKLTEIAVNLVVQAEKVHEVALPPRLSRSVRSSQRNTNSLRLYLPGGGLHLVTDRETSGYGWATVPRDSMDVAGQIRAWAESGLRVPRRTVWTGEWVPPAEVVAETEPVAYRRTFSSRVAAEEWLSRYGLRPTHMDTPPVTDAADLAARMRSDDTQGDVRNLL
jgi:hypothetical protein